MSPLDLDEYARQAENGDLVPRQIDALIEEARLYRELNEHATRERERMAGEIDRLSRNGAASMEATMSDSHTALRDLAQKWRDEASKLRSPSTHNGYTFPATEERGRQDQLHECADEIEKMLAEGGG